MIATILFLFRILFFKQQTTSNHQKHFFKKMDFTCFQYFKTFFHLLIFALSVFFTTYNVIMSMKINDNITQQCFFWTKSSLNHYFVNASIWFQVSSIFWFLLICQILNDICCCFKTHSYPSCTFTTISLVSTLLRHIWTICGWIVFAFTLNCINLVTTSLPYYLLTNLIFDHFVFFYHLILYHRYQVDQINHSIFQ